MGVTFMLDERAYIIIQKILERPFIEKKDLLRKIQLTQRQFDYSLEKINSWLNRNDCQPIVLNNHDQLTIYNKTKEILLNEISGRVPSKMYVLSSQKRMKSIFFLLFLDTEYLSMNHLIDALKVGKTTIMSDLKHLNTTLQESNISIEYNRKKGYYLQGNESDIRYLIIKVILSELNEESHSHLLDHFLHANQMEDYEAIKSIVLQAMKKHHISFAENRLKEFIYSFLFLKQRFEKINIKTVKSEYLPSLKTKKEYLFAKELLEHYDYDCEEGISYLCVWILGLTTGDVDEDIEDYNMIMNLVDHIRIRFESFSGIHFEQPEEVSKQLYQHFRSVFYRLYYKLPIINPLYEKIKEEYRDLYLIVSKTLQPIGKVLRREIPKEEIAFLTIHFASLATCFSETKMKQKVALIVCPNGTGSSSITYNVLKSIFPEFKFLFPIETMDIDKVEDYYDIVFSTVPNILLFYTKKPVYIVSPVMNSVEKYQLIRDVYTELGNSVFKLPNVDEIINIVEKFTLIEDKNSLKKALYDYLVVNENVSIEKGQGPMLSDIISPGLIQLNRSATDWQEAISISAGPLVLEERITEQYVKKMIDNVKKDGPYIVIMKHVALPHSRPDDGVNQLSIGITVFNEPVFFDKEKNNPVKYVFCLAAVDKEKHINALSQLIRLLENDDFYRVLENSHHPKEVYDFICMNEN
jgi:transcriptional antiterminator/mannitol/fructose-specific phosphotransferase system IIA component (Ntr-type)